MIKQEQEGKAVIYEEETGKKAYINGEKTIGFKRWLDYREKDEKKEKKRNIIQYIDEIKEDFKGIIRLYLMSEGIKDTTEKVSKGVQIFLEKVNSDDKFEFNNSEVESVINKNFQKINNECSEIIRIYLKKIKKRGTHTNIRRAYEYINDPSSYFVEHITPPFRFIKKEKDEKGIDAIKIQKDYKYLLENLLGEKYIEEYGTNGFWNSISTKIIDNLDYKEKIGKNTFISDSIIKPRHKENIKYYFRKELKNLLYSYIMDKLGKEVGNRTDDIQKNKKLTSEKLKKRFRKIYNTQLKKYSNNKIFKKLLDNDFFKVEPQRKNRFDNYFLPIRHLDVVEGVGRKTIRLLRDNGFRTIGQLVCAIESDRDEILNVKGVGSHTLGKIQNGIRNSKGLYNDMEVRGYNTFDSLIDDIEFHWYKVWKNYTKDNTKLMEPKVDKTTKIESKWEDDKCLVSFKYEKDLVSFMHDFINSEWNGKEWEIPYFEKNVQMMEESDLFDVPNFVKKNTIQVPQDYTEYHIYKKGNKIYSDSEYDEDLIEIIKSLPKGERKWNGLKKRWEINAKAFKDIKSELIKHIKSVSDYYKFDGI